MSIVPANQGRGTALELLDDEGFFPMDLWDPISFFPSLETHVDWKQNSRAHVLRAVFPGFSGEDVFVYIDDDNMLEISTEKGDFMSKFKLPDNANRNEMKACMVNGVLTVTIPKQGATTPNVRTIEISGSG